MTTRPPPQRNRTEELDDRKAIKTLVILVVTVAVPPILQRTVDLLDDHVFVGLSIAAVCFVLAVVALLQLRHRLPRDPIARGALLASAAMLFALSIVASVEWAVRPRAEISGSVTPVLDETPFERVEANVFALSGKHVGRAAITDDLGNFRVSALRADEYHVLLLKRTDGTLSYTEFATSAKRRGDSASTYTFPRHQTELFAPETIYFDHSSSEIHRDAHRKLLKTANLLMNDPEFRGYRLLIHAHCSLPGTTDFNTQLGDRRADAVVNALTEFGVDAGRLIPISYGEIKPLTTEDGEDSQAQNRRVEFVLLPPNDSYLPYREARLVALARVDRLQAWCVTPALFTGWRPLLH